MKCFNLFGFSLIYFIFGNCFQPANSSCITTTSLVRQTNSTGNTWATSYVGPLYNGSFEDTASNKIVGLIIYFSYGYSIIAIHANDCGTPTSDENSKFSAICALNGSFVTLSISATSPLTTTVTKLEVIASGTSCVNLTTYISVKDCGNIGLAGVEPPPANSVYGNSHTFTCNANHTGTPVTAVCQADATWNLPNISFCSLRVIQPFSIFPSSFQFIAGNVSGKLDLVKANFQIKFLINDKVAHTCEYNVSSTPICTPMPESIYTNRSHVRYFITEHNLHISVTLEALTLEDKNISVTTIDGATIGNANLDVRLVGPIRIFPSPVQVVGGSLHADVELANTNFKIHFVINGDETTKKEIINLPVQILIFVNEIAQTCEHNTVHRPTCELKPGSLYFSRSSSSSDFSQTAVTISFQLNALSLSDSNISVILLDGIRQESTNFNVQYCGSSGFTGVEPPPANSVFGILHTFTCNADHTGKPVTAVCQNDATWNLPNCSFCSVAVLGDISISPSPSQTVGAYLSATIELAKTNFQVLFVINSNIAQICKYNVSSTCECTQSNGSLYNNRISSSSCTLRSRSVYIYILLSELTHVDKYISFTTQEGISLGNASLGIQYCGNVTRDGFIQDVPAKKEYQSKHTFSCMAGYTGINLQSTCQYDGQWQTDLSCLYVVSPLALETASNKYLPGSTISASILFVLSSTRFRLKWFISNVEAGWCSTARCYNTSSSVYQSQVSFKYERDISINSFKLSMSFRTNAIPSLYNISLKDSDSSPVGYLEFSTADPPF